MNIVDWEFRSHAGANKQRRENAFEDISDFDMKNMV